MWAAFFFTYFLDGNLTLTIFYIPTYIRLVGMSLSLEVYYMWNFFVYYRIGVYCIISSGIFKDDPSLKQHTQWTILEVLHLLLKQECLFVFCKAFQKNNDARTTGIEENIKLQVKLYIYMYVHYRYTHMSYVIRIITCFVCTIRLHAPLYIR